MSDLPKSLLANERLADAQHLKRAEIAEATRTVVSERGVDGASLRIIARKAGCTTGVITHYFANKEELLEYALEHAFIGVEADLELIIESDDVLATLKDMTLKYMPTNEQNRKTWAVWQSYISRADENRRIASIIRRVHGAARVKLTNYIRRGQVLGLVTKDYTAEELSDQWSATLNGLTRLALFENAPLDEESLAKRIDLQIALIRPRNTP